MAWLGVGWTVSLLRDTMKTRLHLYIEELDLFDCPIYLVFRKSLLLLCLFDSQAHDEPCLTLLSA